MANFTRPSKVLVTGASGYFAAHVVLALVERGYNVVGAVRSPKKGEYLKKLARTNFEYVIVPDMTADGAYDEAVKGVDAVLHVASPVDLPDANPDAVIKPAIAGAVGILESAKKNGTNIKRIILTSSQVAQSDLKDDSTWNDAAVEAVKAQGDAANGFYAYIASKVLAERAAWEFIEKNKADIKFDFAVVLPAWIFGPMVNDAVGPQSFGLSVNWVLGGLDPQNPKTGDELTKIDDYQYVDVRDVAAIEAELLSVEKIAGQRYIAAAGPWSWQGVYDALQTLPSFVNTPIGQPGSTNGNLNDETYRSKKVIEAIGKSRDAVFRPFEDTFRDHVQSALTKGWSPKA